jgi:hypothetical protein
MAEKNSLWKNIRNKAKQNRASGAKPKQPTTEMLRQERKIRAQKANGGPIKENPLYKSNEDYVYNQWVQSMPENLRQESPGYNMRGAWEGGLEPEMFYRDEQGNFRTAHEPHPFNPTYEPHLGSRNPNTGEILKSPEHHTYDMAIEGDIRAGYTPRVDARTGTMYSTNSNDPTTAGPFKEYAEGSFVGEDELPTYRYANKEGVIGGPRVTDKGTWLPTTPEGTLVVNMPEFEIISTPTGDSRFNSTPNPYSPVTGIEFLNSGFNPINWLLPNTEQQVQPIDPKTGMPLPQSGLATPVYPETEFIGIKKGKEAIDAFKHVDFSDMSINKSKSSIDWNKWSSDAADNPSVVKHLNEIEKKSKKSGTWMKDFDIKDGKVIFKDTPFKGTPEEFVVQQSDNFRKAFPNGVETMYTGSNRHIFDYANHDEWGKGSKAIFGTSSEANAGAYGWDDVNNKAKPNFNPQDPRLTYEGEMRNGDFEGGVHKLGFSKDIPFVTGEGGGRGWRLVDWNDNVAKGTKLRPRNNESLVKEHNDFLQDIYNNGDYLKRDYDIDGFNPNKEYLSTDLYANYITNPSNPEAVAKVNNTIDTMGKRYMLPQTTFALDPKRVPVKSMRHNIMFDMDNPNIYKSILPAIGTGAVGIGAVDKYYNNQQQAAGGYFPTQGPGKGLFKGYAEGGKYGEDDELEKKLADLRKQAAKPADKVPTAQENFINATKSIPSYSMDPNYQAPAVGTNYTTKEEMTARPYPASGKLDIDPGAELLPLAVFEAMRIPGLVKSYNYNLNHYKNAPKFVTPTGTINLAHPRDLMRARKALNKATGIVVAETVPEIINATGGYYANGGYTNPYNQYQDDLYLQYKVGGKVWQDIGAGAYGVLKGTLGTVTGGLTDSLMDKGYDVLQKAANKNFDPNDPEDLKAIKEINTVKASGQIGGAVLGGIVSGNVKGAASEGIGGVTDIVNSSDASDSAKQWTNTIGGLAKTGLSMGSGKGAGTKGISIPGMDGAGKTGANSIGKIANSAEAGIEMGEDASQFGDVLTNFSGSKFGQNANKVMPYAEQAMGMIGNNKGSLMEQGEAQQDFLNSPEQLELKKQRNQDYINQGLMYGLGGNITNNSLNLRNTMRYKRFAQGGTFDQYGINYIPESAGLHHQSAYGGVLIGPDALAEGGEAKLQMGDGGQYIVSDQVDGANTQTINGQTMAERLKKKLKPYMMGGLASNPKDKENLRRPFDSYSEPTIAQIKENAVQETEAVRMQREGALKYAAHGGKLNKDIEKIVMEEYSAAYGGMLPNKYKGKVNMPNSYAKGGIHIKESKKGTFTAAATKHGKSVQEFAQQVLANKENYSPGMVKKANFAHNAAGWKHADGGYVHNQMTQPMYAVGGPVYGDPASPYTYAEGGPGKKWPWQKPMLEPQFPMTSYPLASSSDVKSSTNMEIGTSNVEPKNTNRFQNSTRIINQYDDGVTPTDTNYIHQTPHEDIFMSTRIDPATNKPIQNSWINGKLRGSLPQDSLDMYKSRVLKDIDFKARGGQINYTNDMYAGGGPMPSNLPQAFDGPSAQNSNGMYAYPDGGMMPPQDQQMMQEQQQAPQEQMQQQPNQEMMMQAVQQAEQMLSQQMPPEQVMGELVKAGVPQEIAMQAVQMAMQEVASQMQQQGQEQPMQGQEQMMLPQGMAHGGTMYASGGPGKKGGTPTKVYTNPRDFQKANAAYTDSLDTYNNLNIINKRIDAQIAKPANQRAFSSQAQFKPWMQGLINTAVSQGDINKDLLQNAPVKQIQHVSGNPTDYTPVTATAPKVKPVFQAPIPPKPPIQQPITPAPAPAPTTPQPRIVGEKTQILDGNVVKQEHLNRQTGEWEDRTPVSNNPTSQPNQPSRYYDSSGNGAWLDYNNPKHRQRIIDIEKAKNQNKNAVPTPNYTTHAEGGMMSPQDGMSSQVAQQLKQGANPEQVLQDLVNKGMSRGQAMAMVQAIMTQVTSEMQQQPQQQMAPPQQMMAARGGYFNGRKQFKNSGWAPNQDKDEESTGTTFSPLADESTMSQIAGLGQSVVPALTSAFAFNKLSKRQIKPTPMQAVYQNRDAEINALRDEWQSQTAAGLRQQRNMGQTAGSVAGNTRDLILSSLKEGQKPIMQIYGEMSAANQQAQQQANLANKQATDDFAKENESMYQNAMQTGFEAAGQGVKNASSYYADLENRKLQRWQAMNTTGENWTWTPRGKAFRNKDGIYMINGIEVDPSTGNEI